VNPRLCSGPIYWKWTTINSHEDYGSKTTNQDTSLTIWQTCSLISKQRIGSRTGGAFIWKEVIIAAHTLCFVWNIAELLYVLRSNHYDGSNIPRFYCVVFPAALSLSLSTMFRDALGYKEYDACSKFDCLQKEKR